MLFSSGSIIQKVEFCLLLSLGNCHIFVVDIKAAILLSVSLIVVDLLHSIYVVVVVVIYGPFSKSGPPGANIFPNEIRRSLLLSLTFYLFFLPSTTTTNIAGNKYKKLGKNILPEFENFHI